MSEPLAEHRDELPEDLDATAHGGAYTFPDIRRRRFSAAIYLLFAAGCLALWARSGSDAVLVNEGLLFASLGFFILGLYHFITAWRVSVSHTDALVEATRKVGFPVGHASAQLAWRGLLSRPTWRVLLYSAENPPLKRGLVLVDGVSGGVVEHFVEDNPEDWSVHTKGNQ